MTDFKAIVSDLRASGMNHSEIAKSVDSSASTVCELETQDGRQPRYPLGMRLVQLHAEKVLKQRRKRVKAA